MIEDEGIRKGGEMQAEEGKQQGTWSSASVSPQSRQRYRASPCSTRATGAAGGALGAGGKDEERMLRPLSGRSILEVTITGGTSLGPFLRRLFGRSIRFFWGLRCDISSYAVLE